MERYKCYSFDLWLTLIKSNPEFKEKRDLMFFEKYNTKKVSLEVVKTHIRTVDVQSNKMSETTGLHVSTEHMVYAILESLNNINTFEHLIDEVVNEIQQLFLEYPPTLYDKNTLKVLQKLSLSSKLFLVSNTGFIKGGTLLSFMFRIPIINHPFATNLKDLFYHTIFSDFCGISKPNPNIFLRIVAVASSFRDIISQEDFLHVGDNPIADGGSEKVRIKFFQINSNDKSIIDLL